ncbi:hypothetical protein ARMSODRAFT_997298 [Armillaria solidipes]|uniref:N-acetyltransferase domain-containing protein n=1 Tax=Armillaria solidipes TaxID=1076256 RepID=A0A2H3ATD1_9AGAR|nr:hypothetical protein ARMSODRAFT_997298 [Armillaria solidipes]
MPSTDFCFPLRSVLEIERVKLVPFDISVHPKLHVDATPPASFYDFLPVGPFQNEQELIASFWEKRIKNGAGETAFAYAGIITYKNTSVKDVVTKIGFLMILPAFQRTHVTSNAVGILMNYALNLPADGGLGLRRVVWTANASNVPSMATAKRLGFQMEGVLRWANAWPEAKIRGSGGAEEFAYGRNLTVLSVCWDDWEGGVKAKVNAEMARRK